jgi:GxxExxY protein
LDHEVHKGHEGHEEPCQDRGLRQDDCRFRPEGSPGAWVGHELSLRGVALRRQVPLPIVYEGAKLDAGYRLDIVVEDMIVIEIKAVEALSRLHEAQVLTYLRLSGRRLGFLLNFNVELFRNGVRRLAL